jgi:hypothetical protein
VHFLSECYRLITATMVELCPKIGVKWCREAAISGRKSTQQNAVVSCGDRRIAYRCFSRHYSRRRLAVLLNSLRHEVVHVVAALQERSSGAIRRNGGRVEAYRVGRLGVSGSRRHHCISCLRPNRFTLGAGQKSSARQICWHSLHGSSCESSGKRVVRRSILYR